MKKVSSALLVILFILAVLPEGIGGLNAPAMAAERAIAQIAAGGSHSFALLSDGSLYAWGMNQDGQLGDGSFTSRKTPVQIGSGFTAIAAGIQHSLALKDNTLYAWGFNYDGRLGNGTVHPANSPTKIGTGYTAIAAGGYHSLALKGNTLYAWGNNQYGQLGDGTNTHGINPVMIGTGYTAIAAGYWHSLALKGNTLYAWGYNSFGQLGDGTNINKNAPVLIGTGFTAIAAGDRHSLALKGNTLYAWGSYRCGQLGDGTDGILTDKNAPLEIGTGYTAIAAGEEFSRALKGNALFAWGSNWDGRLGDGTLITRNVPVQIGAGYTAIAAGSAHSVALKENTIFTCGQNSNCQLGDGTKTWRSTPVEVTIPIRDTGVTISPAAITLYVGGETITLEAIVTPSDATNKNVKWFSSSKCTATVTSGGVVKGMKKGTAIITAQTASGKTAKCAVTVKEVCATGIKLDKSSIKIAVGESLKLQASVAPSNASNKAVTWSSSNKKIAAVTSKGVVTGENKGTATITVKTANGKTAKCKVTVTEVRITDIQLDNTPVYIAVGESFVFLPRVSPSNATTKNITWSSSNKKIATVSSYGVVKGIAAGKVTITARINNGKTAKCTVIVTSG